MTSVPVTSSPAVRRQRKSLGAFYSPRQLVEPLVAWAITRADQSVFDPSCGDGVFLEAAAHRLRRLGAGAEQAAALLRAVDLNPEAASFTRERLHLLLGVPGDEVRVADFFSVASPGSLFGPDRGVDVVIGNPPYIRYQEFAGRARVQALGRASDAGVELTQLASSWAHFVAHAVSFLEAGGRLAFILPAELIHAAYAAPLRQHLRRSFGRVHVISFRTSVFPEVQEEVVLVLAAGKSQGPSQLALAEVEDGLALTDLEGVLAGAEVFAPDEEPEKWSPGHETHPAARVLADLCAAGHFRPLASVGKAGIGFVSGANDYFVLTAEEARRWRLPPSSLRPALVRARHIAGLHVSAADLALLREKGERCSLWLPKERLTRFEQAYVRHGESLGIAERYKCRVRSPWYRVPGVTVPDAFLTYMSDAAPRLCLNRARTVSSNTLLAIRLTKVPASLRRALVTAFYNSATLLSCERTGRSYGGGVLKLEPREADRILLPDVDLVAKHRKSLMQLEPEVDTALRHREEGALSEAIAKIDRLFLTRQSSVNEVSRLRSRLRERRKARAHPR
ncbi:MAG TPA: N-6 DNA methylase [Thermoanaerobaculia bacterium]|nr:N-6 DNA methylase [Thermoanaerobaculia bacterium]